MTTPRPLLLIHSIYGLRPAIRDAAKRLADAGFDVESPDYCGGRTADHLEDALAIRDTLDGERVFADLREAADRVRARCGGAPLTVIGFSYGLSRAVDLALADAAVQALVLFHGGAYVPEGARLQARVLGHYGTGDDLDPPEEVEAFYAQLRAAGATVTAYAYPGAGHLFTDSGLQEYDAAAAELAWQCTLGWLRA